MIIFHLITSIDKGGAETHLYSLVKKQINKGNTVVVIYLKGTGYWKRFYKKLGVKVFRFNLENKYNFFQLFNIFHKIKKLIIKYKPSIVHSHLTTMEFFGALLSFKFKSKFKFIVTKHLDSFFFEASRGQKKKIRGIMIDRFIIGQAYKVICISNQVKNYFKKKIPYKNKYKVIYYGFSEKEFRYSKNIRNILKNFKKKYKIKNTDFILCNIARHVKQKSVDIILKAFYIYLNKNKNSKLVLVGKGPETKNLKKLAVELGINNNICWIENYENIKDIYKLSDIFILSSKYEGLGLVLLEALSCKIPIIATRTSAIPEIIINNYNGLLFNVGDYRSLVNNLYKINNRTLVKKLTKNGSIFLKEKFNLDEMSFQTSKVYKS